MAKMIDPLCLDAAEIMKYVQKQYFKLFNGAPPYESLGYSILYNRMLPEGGRMVQRMGRMVNNPPRLEGFLEPGFHAALGQNENNHVCDNILQLFTVEDNVPLQWEFDITTQGVWEQIIYEVPWIMPLSGAVHRFPSEDRWLNANDSGAVREIDFTQLEDEVLILKDVESGAQTTVTLASEQVEQIVKVLEFWLKVEAHLNKIKAGKWILSHRHLKLSNQNVIALSNQGQQPSLLDIDHTLKRRMGADALMIKGDMFRLAGVLMHELIQEQEK